MTHDVTKIHQFQEACRAQQDAWRKALEEIDLQTLVSVLHVVVVRVSEQSGELFPARRQDGYHMLFFELVRKLLLACLRKGCARPVWQEVGVKELCKMGPDRCDHLQAFPASWSVAEISNFLFARPDLGLFAGMYTCLWGAVCPRAPDCQTKDEILAKMREDKFADIAQVLWDRWKHAPSPHSVIREAFLHHEG